MNGSKRHLPDTREEPLGTNGWCPLWGVGYPQEAIAAMIVGIGLGRLSGGDFEDRCISNEWIATISQIHKYRS